MIDPPDHRRRSLQKKLKRKRTQVGIFRYFPQICLPIFARHTGAGSATKLKMTPIRIVLTNIFLLFTLSAYSENVVDSLVTAFNHQKGSQAARTAEAFFRYLAESGFTENTVELIPGSEADSVKALTLYWAGEWYYDIQDYDRSIEYSSKALSLSRKVSAKEIECDCDNILSIAYFRKSDFHKSLEYAKATLALGRELQDEERITYSLNTLAGICLASKQPAEGVKYVLEAIRICEKRNDSLKLAVRCGMAAEIHHSMGEDERSLEYSRRAYDINKAMGLEDKAAVRLSQMAAAQIALGRHDDAEKSLLEALPELEKAGNLQSWAISCNHLGDLCLQKGDNEKAVEYFRAALKVFTDKGDAYNKSHSHYGLSRALTPRNSNEAIEHLMLYTHIKDSLYNSEMNQGLNEYNARYRNEQITSERDHHLNSKRRILWCGIAAVALLAFAIWFLARRNKSIKFILDDTMAKLDAARKRTASRPSQTPERDVVEPLKAEIRKQIMEGKEVDLQEAAAVLCTTRSNLNRQIKAQTGGSSSALVTEVRIEMAKEILSGQKDKPVSEVAMLCGINDVSYFITLFKKVTGTTPKQWRDGNIGQ